MYRQEKMFVYKAPLIPQVISKTLMSCKDCRSKYKIMMWCFTFFGVLSLIYNPALCDQDLISKGRQLSSQSEMKKKFSENIFFFKRRDCDCIYSSSINKHSAICYTLQGKSKVQFYSSFKKYASRVEMAPKRFIFMDL